MPRSRSRVSRRQRAGAIRMPSEYYGGDSGRYTSDPNAGLCANAYGETTAQSQGASLGENMVGPNLFAHPDGTGTQTGGRRRRRSRSRSRSKSRSRSRSRRSRSRRRREKKKKREEEELWGEKEEEREKEREKKETKNTDDDDSYLLFIISCVSLN